VGSGQAELSGLVRWSVVLGYFFPMLLLATAVIALLAACAFHYF